MILETWKTVAQVITAKLENYLNVPPMLVEAGRVEFEGTVSRRDAAVEPTGMYSRRVPSNSIRPAIRLIGLSATD